MEVLKLFYSLQNQYTMTTISKINAISRNAEVNEVAEAFIVAFGKQDFSADHYLTEVFASLRQGNAELTTAIKASGAISRQNLCDEERDRAGRALFLCTNAACELPDPAIAQSAAAVSTVLDKYGLSMFRSSYDEETTLIRSLLEELGELADEVQAVPQLLLHLNHLKQRQDDFDKAKEEYVKSQAEGKAIRSASKVRVEIMDLLNKNLIPYLNTMNKVTPAVYGSFVALCAELATRNNQRVKRRQAAVTEDQEQ